MSGNGIAQTGQSFGTTTRICGTLIGILERCPVIGRLKDGIDRVTWEDWSRLAQKDSPQEWDVLLLEQVAQSADAPPLKLHRAFVGQTGEYRAGPVIPRFEVLYEELARRTSQVRLAWAANRIDRFVYDEALALFLCAPQALYAVNRHVDFKAYRTTFELAECRVSKEHWSQRR